MRKKIYTTKCESTGASFTSFSNFHPFEFCVDMLQYRKISAHYTMIFNLTDLVFAFVCGIGHLIQISAHKVPQAWKVVIKIKVKKIVELSSQVEALRVRERRRDIQYPGLKAQLDVLLSSGGIPPCPGDVAFPPRPT